MIINNLGYFKLKHQTHKSNCIFFRLQIRVKEKNREKKGRMTTGIETTSIRASFAVFFFFSFLAWFWFLLERLFWSHILINLLFKRSVCEERRLIYLRVDIAIRHNHISAAIYIFELFASSLALFFFLSWHYSHEFIKLFFFISKTFSVENLKFNQNENKYS